jgi:hypothetical protein
MGDMPSPTWSDIDPVGQATTMPRLLIFWEIVALPTGCYHRHDSPRARHQRSVAAEFGRS